MTADAGSANAGSGSDRNPQASASGGSRSSRPQKAGNQTQRNAQPTKPGASPKNETPREGSGMNAEDRKLMQANTQAMRELNKNLNRLCDLLPQLSQATATSSGSTADQELQQDADYIRAFMNNPDAGNDLADSPNQDGRLAVIKVHLRLALKAQDPSDRYKQYDEKWVVPAVNELFATARRAVHEKIQASTTTDTEQLKAEAVEALDRAKMPPTILGSPEDDAATLFDVIAEAINARGSA